MWAQTHKNVSQHYRDHSGSRGEGACVNAGGTVRCDVVDDQVGQIIEPLVLPKNWLEAVLEHISLKDEVMRVRSERERTQEKLRRLGKAYVDELIDEPDYQRQKAQYEFELASLVVPEADAVAEAGRLIQHLPELWAKAGLSEMRRLLFNVVDAVYVDTRDPEAGIVFTPKAVFEPVFAEAEYLEDSVQRYVFSAKRTGGALRNGSALLLIWGSKPDGLTSYLG